MKIRLIVYIILTSSLVSCSSSRKTIAYSKKQLRQVEIVEEKLDKYPSVNQFSHVRKLEKNNKSLNKYRLDYIEKYAPIAVVEMHEYKIPASITLAQGILESGSGRSTLATKSNNHFGIKCHKGWKGDYVRHDDDELQECFRKYKYPENSYKDHSIFLTSRSRYSKLFELNIYNYKGWARGLKKAGYATDKKYPQKIITIIEDYKLYEFDKFSSRDFKKSKKARKKLEKYEKKQTDPVSYQPTSKFYIVVKGDTLYSISKRFGLSADDIKKKNALLENTISIGQKLKL